jgi:hypothetical protein
MSDMTAAQIIFDAVKRGKKVTFAPWGKDQMCVQFEKADDAMFFFVQLATPESEPITAALNSKIKEILD